MSIVITDKCCPADWLDEVPPELGKHPNDFLRLKDGEIYLTPLDEADDFLAGDLTEDGSYQLKRLDTGQEVEFMFTEGFGSMVFTVGENGEIVFAQPAPEGANLFGSGPDLVICETPEAAAKELLKEDDEARSIDAWYWSDGVTYVLCLDAAGAPFFTRKRTDL